MIEVVVLSNGDGVSRLGLSVDEEPSEEFKKPRGHLHSSRAASVEYVEQHWWSLAEWGKVVRTSGAGLSLHSM
jgi:hypothetical protein